MPEVRYTLPGIPRGPAAGLTAFTPHFNRAAAGGAQSYKYGVAGGSARMVPVSTRDTTPSPDLGDIAQMGGARSSDAPEAFWPDQYMVTVNRYEYPGAGMPIAFYSPTQPGRTTLLPVPAEDYRAQYQRDSARITRRAILNRVRQLPWFPRIYSAPDM